MQDQGSHRGIIFIKEVRLKFTSSEHDYGRSYSWYCNNSHRDAGTGLQLFLQAYCYCVVMITLCGCLPYYIGPGLPESNTNSTMYHNYNTKSAKPT